MSFFGTLFGSNNSLNKVIETAERLTDDAFYTDAEKAADKKEGVTEARKMIVDWVEASSGSRLSRRILALSITGVWLFQKLASTILVAVGPWVDPSITTALNASAEVVVQSNNDMQTAVTIILGFYFAAPYMGDMVQGALNKFGKTDTKTEGK